MPTPVAAPSSRRMPGQLLHEALTRQTNQRGQQAADAQPRCRRTSPTKGACFRDGATPAWAQLPRAFCDCKNGHSCLLFWRAGAGALSTAAPRLPALRAFGALRLVERVNGHGFVSATVLGFLREPSGACWRHGHSSAQLLLARGSSRFLPLYRVKARRRNMGSQHAVHIVPSAARRTRFGDIFEPSQHAWAGCGRNWRAWGGRGFLHACVLPPAVLPIRHPSSLPCPA